MFSVDGLGARNYRSSKSNACFCFVSRLCYDSSLSLLPVRRRALRHRDLRNRGTLTFHLNAV